MCVCVRCGCVLHELFEGSGDSDLLADQSLHDLTEHFVETAVHFLH